MMFKTHPNSDDEIKDKVWRNSLNTMVFWLLLDELAALARGEGVQEARQNTQFFLRTLTEPFLLDGEVLFFDKFYQNYWDAYNSKSYSSEYLDLIPTDHLSVILDFVKSFLRHNQLNHAILTLHYLEHRLIELSRLYSPSINNVKGEDRAKPFVAPLRSGRNQKCWCGSGEKHKDCCLVKVGDSRQYYPGVVPSKPKKKEPRRTRRRRKIV